jgi:LPS-assembly protein
MKNNTKIIIFLFFSIFLIVHNKIYASEIQFNTSEINITDNGNTTNAGPGSAYSVVDNIKIDGQSFKFDKTSSLLIANSAKVFLSEKNIEIQADELFYDQKISTIRALGNVKIKDFTQNITLSSEDIIYKKNENIIISNVKSTLVNEIGNNLISEEFTYSLNDKLIKISKAKIIDSQKNIFYIEKAFLNLLTNKLIGKDMLINFNAIDETNKPRLKGKSVSSDENKTVVEKGVFTTCKRRDDCPPWEFLAKKITHNKKKKTINYENAWLKIYGKPVLYFPKFFHPDPSVKRQSGFLMPAFTNSSSAGSAFKLPYFHVISHSKDLTFTPRLYSTKKILSQSEYRAVNAKSKHVIDFSILSEKNRNSKTHFFSRSKKELNLNYFNNSNLTLEMQHTSNDTYLKSYKLKSPLINNETGTLTSTLGFRASNEGLDLETNFIVYENLSDVSSGDKYEYVFPNYAIKKDLYSDVLTSGNFNLNSNGYMKNYNTNVFEKVIINDFLYSSYPKFTNTGFKNNYNILFKNINTDSKNSKNYKENSDIKISTLAEYNSSYPLEKKTRNYLNMIKPIISARYSPNNSKNIKDADRRINVNNVFSLNRLGVNDSVEGGGSLSFGTEYYKTDFSNREVVIAKIANVFKLEEDKNLPINSSLGKKTSDIFGYINFNPNNFFNINYEFSQDENLKDTKYQLLKNEFKINNFVTTFEYLNQNNGTNKESYISNKTIYNFKKSNSFIFERRENKETDATEFYNLMYQYRNDCLIAEIQYNKDYYTDRDLKPNESIFLNFTIIPFGGTKSPNLKK